VLAVVALVENPTSSAAPLVIDLATSTNSIRIDADRSYDYLGAAVAVCDLSGDGTPDVLLGASGGDGPGNLRSDAGEINLVWTRRGRWSGTHTIESLRHGYIVGEEGFDQLAVMLACGDVNRDGLADIVAGAASGDGPGNVRDSTGQAHIIFGRAVWPVYLDLAVEPGTVIYGKAINEGLGVQSIVGDIDGDGQLDVLVNAPQALSKNDTIESGRVYAFFSRVTWPATIDLATQAADVTFFGRNLSNFGSDHRVGDLDQDGTDDVVISARLGDTPVGGRTDAGDVFLFRGRANWPASFDMQTQPQSATTRLYGIDAFDYTGDIDGLAIGDLDNDRIADLSIGLRGADGRSNTVGSAGEIRNVTPGVSWPATIDLATGTRQVIYGARAADVLGTHIYIGDVNGDGTSDSVYSGPEYDGDAQERPRCGFVSTTLGRTAFPLESDFADGDDDWRILGDSDWGLKLGGLTDVNADGISEIVVRNDSTSTRPNTVWFVSPLDIDNDGFQQLADNCPLVGNPDQLDADSDLVGDACQLDYDGDGANDPDDCAPSNRSLGRPGAIRGVSLSGASPTTIQWQPNIAADTYSVLRGLVSELSNSNYGSCQDLRDPNTADTSFVESEQPPSGASFFFLVLGRDAGCGGRGTLGRNSSGAERINQNPGNCP
jgi:hypothetical protein